MTGKPARKQRSEAATIDVAAMARRIGGRPFAVGPASQVDQLLERVLREGATYTSGDPRDIGVKGGYPQVNYGQDHKALLEFVRLAYKRSAPARVLVDRVAEEEWGEWFELTGGREGFRQAVEAFMKRPTGRIGERPLWWWFKRSTRLARRDGRSLLHFGLIENGDPETEQPPSKAVQGVSYLQIITQDRILDKEVGDDPSKPKEFGEVLRWKIAFTREGEPDERWLHADRVIPFIPEPSEDDMWEGDSILATNVNYVEAIENMLFSSLQAYHREAEPMLVVYRDGSGATTEGQKKAVKDEIRKVVEMNTERTAFVHGVRVEVLDGSGNLANPTPHWDIAVQAYAMATGIPRPILTGENIGELVAATEASKRWANIISRLQETDADPTVNTLLTRLEAWGVERWAFIPGKDQVEIKWNNVRQEDPHTDALRKKTEAEARAIYWSNKAPTPEELDYPVTTDPDMLDIAEAIANKPAPTPFGAVPPGGLPPTTPDPAEEEASEEEPDEEPVPLAEAVGPTGVPVVINAMRGRIESRIQSARKSAGSVPTDKAGARKYAKRVEKEIRRALPMVIVESQEDAYGIGQRITAKGIKKVLAVPREKREAADDEWEFEDSPFRTIAIEVGDEVAARYSLKVRETLLEGIEAGEGLRELTTRIRDVFAVSTSDAQRIARTEAIRAYNRGTRDRLKSAGLQDFVFVALSGADEECQERNGNTYNVDDLGNQPPIHVSCRCSMRATIQGRDTGLRVRGETVDGVVAYVLEHEEVLVSA